jgi:hypothetical protein
MEKGLGVDPSDTQTMVNLAIGAKNGNLQATTLLGSNLKAYVNLGSVTGVLNLPESEGVTSVNPEYDVIDAAGNVIRAGTPRPKEPNLQKNALGQLVDVETGVVRPGFEATTPSGSEAANKAQADTTRFSDGSMLIVSTDGTRTYLGPDGEEIKGAANIAAFNERTAELAKTDAGIIAANTLAMKNAVTKAEKGYAEVAIIRGNALTYQQAIDAVINDGANTGAIVSRFPSLTDGGKKLEQAQNVLSLDIVQSTTFGALSKGELDLAKATAIPSGLTEEALVEWIKSKMAADEKVANIIEEASDYMGITGNTISGYYREKRKQYNEDVAAVKYARENPDDPNSPAILAANPNL